MNGEPKPLVILAMGIGIVASALVSVVLLVLKFL